MSNSSGGQASNGRPPVGEAEGVSKTFGETRALKPVSLTVLAGECHALVGRNGAGKSTLVSLLTGLNRPDSGSIRLGGEPAPSLADRAAWQRRVACVYQKSMVVGSLTVAENIFLNRPTQSGWRAGIIDWGRVRSQAREVLGEWGFDLDVEAEAVGLNVEQKQVVEIVRALSIGARFLILDEPTASLEKAAVERLFKAVRRLRASGVGILYISHHLEEIYEICDRVTVLRDGEQVLSTPVVDVTQENLVAAMVGAAAAPRVATAIEATVKRGQLGPTQLEVTGLSVVSLGGSVEDVSLKVAAGECVGLVGLNGSGSVTVADTVVGLHRPASGEIRIVGKPVPPGRVHAVVGRSLGYVPPDRHVRGFAPQLGVGENLTMAVLDRLSKWGWVSLSEQTRLARQQAADLQIVAGSLEQPVSSLSGGNQQKVVVGRALAADPPVLVVVTPTVGVDVASKDALLDRIERARDSGKAVLLVSDDLEDLRVCSRLLVMVRGRISREFTRPPWDRHELIAAVEGLEPAGKRKEDSTHDA